MAGPEERGGRGAGGSGEAQAQGQPRDSAMAPMQPSLGPPRDEPRVFGLDKFNGDNFAEWSFKMENIFDHYDLLEVMEGMEKRPENDPEKSPWVRKSAQGYLLLGQALGSSQIRHIKPFQHEPEKGPKAWAALKGVHAPATAAVAVVLERQMAALRIEEDEAVEEGVQKFFDLLTRLEGADLNYSELQKKTKLLALLPESWSSLIINLNRDLPHLSLEDKWQSLTRYPFSSSEATAKAPLDEVVMDVVGPLKLGAAGAEYFLTIVDAYTRMTWVYVLSKKSDVAETVKTDWLPMVERQQDRLVKAIRTDRGGEFLSKEFSLWLKKNGIRHSLTMPYSPAMNGIAGRANRTITETARGLLIEARLPDYFWPYAVRSACVAKNRALTHVGADKWVPYVEWIGRKPKVDMLRVFGCMCLALVPKHLRHNKLGAKAIWAVHLGMAQNSKGWLLWDPFTKKFLLIRDCKFMENLMYKDWKVENEAKIGVRLGDVKSSGLEHVELPLELSSGSTTTRQSSLVNGGEEAKDAEEEEEEVQQVSERAPTLPSRTMSAPRIRVTPQQRQGLHVPAAEEEGRGKRRIQAPKRLTYDALGRPAKLALAGAALVVGEDEEKGNGSELKSIEESGTWEWLELPEGRMAITSNWLFKIKSDADGKIERYKSRLVAKGYQQKEKVDYKELFAPVVKPTTLRTLLTGAAIKGWVVKQMDVTTAFLNGVLEEEIFMAQPEGFDDGSGRVLRLKKALYGLKQAPRQWYLKLRGVLEEISFTPSTADHSLFMLGEGEQRSFMVVYVDDILIFSPSSDLVKEVMLKLQDMFKCKALGDVSFYLGLHIERDVEKRCMRGPEESVGEEERRRFHSLVGSLMYVAVNTRPDVAFATGQLARVVQCPNEEQVAAGMRVAKYLGQTPTVGLQFSAAAQRRQKGADGVEPGRLFLAAFSDASYASEPEDMTSVGWFICCVGGGPTAWEIKKQVDQALSSVEFEYMALFRAVREIVWQQRLLAELGEEQQGPTPLYCDSQGAIALAKNPVLHGLTKHMRVKWHWTRNMVAAGEVELYYVKTTGQPADMMTKRLVEQQHWKCCKLAGMALN
ncbi:unnamed protein product [Closterium sp. NIES-54]